MKYLFILSAILLLSSCAFHSGTNSSNVTNDPVVYKDIATGVSTANVVLGFGGLSKDAVISDARKNMVISRPLQGAEQYNNIDVNIKRTYYVFGLKTKVTITADVIEPKDSINQASYSETYLKKIDGSSAKNDLFAVGDSVIIYNANYQSGQITHIYGYEMDRVEVVYTDRNNVSRTKNVSINRIYIAKPEHRGLTQLERTSDGVIAAFGIKHALVKVSGGYIKTKYPK